jgi:aspartate kinase
MNAVECQNIKDVPGVYQIEPRIEINENAIENQARILNFMSSDEAIQISGRGSMVVHPDAVDIAREASIPIRVKNLKPGEGTIIFPNKTQTTRKNPVAAISAGKYYLLSVSDRILVLPEQSKGYMHAITGILLESDVSFADNETPASVISIAIPEKYDGKIKVDIEGITRELEDGLKKQGYEPNYVGYDEAVGISFVGDSMRGTPGVTARIAGALAKEGVNIVMGGQSNEKVGPTCISYYVEVKDAERALKALCKELF